MILSPGTQVIYVPDHADSILHKDAEHGFVTSQREGDEETAFVCYFTRDAIAKLKTRPGYTLTINDVRTRSASELTPTRCLRRHYFTSQPEIEAIRTAVTDERRDAWSKA